MTNSLLVDKYKEFCPRFMYGAVYNGMFLLLYGARREGGLTAIRGILAREVTLQPNPVRDKLVRTLSIAPL